MTRYDDNDFKYDVFVSHNRQQKPWVRQFVRLLRSEGLVVFFDEDSIVPGADIIESIEHGIVSSRFVVLMLSPQTINSTWVTLETAITVYADPSARENRLVPVMIVPLSLKDIRPAVRRLNIVDLTDPVTRRDKFIWLVEHLGIEKGTEIEPPQWPDENESTQITYRRLLPAKIVHDLPPAPRFVGREFELSRLEEFWNSNEEKVLSLIGLGGAGKTAVLQRFLSKLLTEESFMYDGVLVWSFYEETDSALFLQTAYEYFAGERRYDIKGANWLHILKDCLSGGEKYLLVLDGLERIQYTRHTERHAFGELEDHLLRGVLQRIAAATGNTKSIITTRFPVSDLERWKGAGYVALNVEQLDDHSALRLLHNHDINGDDQSLLQIIHKYGAHALTLDHLGSLVFRFFDGDPSHLLSKHNISVRGKDPQARKLKTIFDIYEQVLPKRELAVLSRLCVFRLGVTADLLAKVFVGSDTEKYVGIQDMDEVELLECLDSLSQYHLVLREGKNKYTVHPAVRDHFYRLFARPEKLHHAIYSELAGLVDRPGVAFPQDTKSLDRLEDLIYHALAAGQVKAAQMIYYERLGGGEHLGWNIGEYARGYRILKQFPEQFDHDGWWIFRRGVGDMPSEKEFMEIVPRLSWYMANEPENVLLLLGNLPA